MTKHGNYTLNISYGNHSHVDVTFRSEIDGKVYEGTSKIFKLSKLELVLAQLQRDSSLVIPETD